MDVSIVILNYNQKNFLKVCLTGILKIAPKLDYEIIVVDNASNDKSREFLSPSSIFKIYSGILKNNGIDKSRIKIILNKNNLGFAGGCNVGIKNSQGKYILLLNPDIAVLDESIEKLFRYMEENKDVGIVGPQLLNPDKTIQKSCYRYPKWYMPILRRTILGKLPWARKELKNYLMDDFNHQEAKEVDWILGAALMVRQEMLKKIGLLDERFFLYFEDVDLCRRAKNNGWRVVYYPEAKMFHYYQRDSAGRGIFSIFSRFTWIHIASAFKYFLKWRSS